MALSTRTREWLGAASAGAIAELRQELARLGDQLAECRRDQAHSAAKLGEELALARGETEAVRQELRVLVERVKEQADRQWARVEDVEDLRRRLDRSDGIDEEIRTKIAGLSEQWRWESEDMRKALTALAERTTLSVKSSG